MTNNQIDPNLEPNENQLSDKDLKEVAGGGSIGDIVVAGKDLVKDVVDEDKDFISSVGDAFKEHL